VKRVLVVDDEDSILKVVDYALSQAGYEVHTARDGNGAEFMCSQINPDLVILDVMLPGKSGLDIAKDLRASSDVPIIMLSARGDEVDRVLGLEFGADDYVTKPFSPRELKARIKAVLRRRAPEAAQEPLEVGPLKLDPATHRVTVDGRPVTVGPTEFRLLRFFLARPERVHSRTQLLDQVWGDQVYIEERTVDVHIRRLRLALEPVGLAGMIETVRGSGYRLATPR